MRGRLTEVLRAQTRTLLVLAAALASVLDQTTVWILSPPHPIEYLLAIAFIAATTALVKWPNIGQWAMLALLLTTAVFENYNPAALTHFLLLAFCVDSCFRNRWPFALIAIAISAVGLGSDGLPFAAVDQLDLGLVACMIGLFLRKATQERDRAKRETLDAALNVQREMAGMIHDFTARSLSHSVMQLRLMRAQCVEGERQPNVSDLEIMEQNLLSVLHETRDLIGEMRSESVNAKQENIGMEGVLRAQSLDWGKVRNLYLESKQDITQRIPLRCSRLANRTLGEIMANAEKYALAGSTVRLRVATLDQRLQIEQWNYIQPDITRDETSGGSGLELLKQSIEAAGGRLETQVDGKKWTISVTLPLNK